jgi:hypothetical protein
LCAEGLLNEIIGCRLILKKDRLKVAKNKTLRSQNGGSLPGVFFTFGAMAIAGFPSASRLRAATLILD